MISVMVGQYQLVRAGTDTSFSTGIGTSIGTVLGAHVHF